MKINKRKLLRLYEKILVFFYRPYMSVRVKRLQSEGMRIGNNCRIFSDLTLSEPYLVSIGDNVTISTNCYFLTHDNSVIKFMDNATDIMGEIVIGDNCFIGANAIILPGISLAKGTIVGAGAVVCKSINEEGCVIAGNPAKIVSSTLTMKHKYADLVFNLRGLNKAERKYFIETHREKLVKK